MSGTLVGHAAFKLSQMSQTSLQTVVCSSLKSSPVRHDAHFVNIL